MHFHQHFGGSSAPSLLKYSRQLPFKSCFHNLKLKYQLYRQMSTTDRKSRNRQVTSNQKPTIFDLLKRKQTNTLLQTVSKSFQKSHLKNSQNFDFDYPQTKEQTNRINYKSTVKEPQSITPMKILFQQNRVSQITLKMEEDQNSRENNHKGKSFLSMISAAKNRSSSVVEQRKQNDNKANIGYKKSQKPCNYQRQNVTKSVGCIRDKLANLQGSLKKIKLKSRELVLLLNLIFDSVSSETHSLSSQTGQVKNVLKSLDILVGQICQTYSAQAIDVLQGSFEEHLKVLESQIRRAQIQEKNMSITAIQDQKERQAQKLRLDLKKTLKDNQLLIRKIEKMQNAQERTNLNSIKQQNTRSQQAQRLKLKLQQTTQQFQRKHSDLEKRLKQSLSNLKELEKQLKNEKMGKEDLKTKFAKDIHEVNEAKNQQLIEEIMILKAQFNADMSRINQLHGFKEFQLASKLKQKEEQLAKFELQNQSNKQIYIRMREENNLIKQNNTKLKIQIDALVADLHRINEELYQHWMALKDIRVLATRLGSFSHFRLIYEDIGFKDHLFL